MTAGPSRIAGLAESPYWQRVPDGWPIVAGPDLGAFSQAAASTIGGALASFEDAFALAPPPLAALAHRWVTEGPLSTSDLLVLASTGRAVPFAAADRLVSPGSWHRASILRAAAEVDDEVGLVMAGPEDLDSMERLHAIVDATLTGTGLGHVTRGEAAVFLCSRLRPRLFPPCVLLTTGRGDRERWQLYRAALDHPAVLVQLREARRVWQDAREIEDLAILGLAYELAVRAT